jgi:hypothetical protein
MSNPDDAFVQATDNLLVLYRNLERHTLDLPLVSVMPVLIFFWSVVKFEFFLIIGIVLIIPVNVVILVRNLFPGHWRYRPFFLTHIYYFTTCGSGFGEAKRPPHHLYLSVPC